jgi:hypothetical protein
MATKVKGLSLAKRLDAWTRAFAARKDLKIKVHKRGRPWKGAPSSIYAPGDVDQFYTENNGFQLTWHFKKPVEGAEEGGILDIPTYSGTRIIWYDDRGHRAAKYIEGFVLDAQSGENTTFVARRYLEGTKKTETVLISDHTSSMTARDFPTLEAYLTEGASKAFAYYWQQHASPPAILATLRATSLAPDTAPEKIVARLVERGLTSEEASALHAWLGPSTCLLLEAE